MTRSLVDVFALCCITTAAIATAPATEEKYALQLQGGVGAPGGVGGGGRMRDGMLLPCEEGNCWQEAASG